MEVIHQSQSTIANSPTNIFRKFRVSAKTFSRNEPLPIKSNSSEQKNSLSATLTIVSNYSVSSQNCYGTSCQGNPEWGICTITLTILCITLYHPTAFTALMLGES